MPSLGGWEFVILIVVVVLLFGARKLPDMARSIGQSARVFKGEMKGMKADDEARTPAEPQPPAELPPGTPVAPQAANPQQPNPQPVNPQPNRTDTP